MLKLIFGKERHLLLLSSQNVSSEKIVATGFQFKFPYLDNALKNLYEKES
jgi:NAD dependent epimerase/dehydratase family enzyme